MNGTEVQNIAPADVPELWALCNRDNERWGTDYAVPRLFSEDDELLPNIPLALKVVDRGRIVQAHVFERQLELLTYGADPRATALSLPALLFAEKLLERLGYRGFHALVARGRIRQFDQAVAQRLNMERDDGRVAHFYRPFGGRA